MDGTATIFDQIYRQPNGAQFRRADLHIHSFGAEGSSDVEDESMTPENIVDTAIMEKIEVISIADHNKFANVERAVKYSQGKSILVIPGVELSTSQGHLLLYFPDFDSLRRCYGKFDFSADYKTCNHTIVQCLDKAKEYGGLGVAAHVDLASGFEEYEEGYKPFKEDILKNPNLLALEIANPSSLDWFTEEDSNENRRKLFRARLTAISEDENYSLGKIMSSDAHSLDALGRNASGNKKITRLKMDSLSFEAFKIALIDASARVRLEEELPTEVPQFLGMKLVGGLLDGQVVRFSNNLTCIIGGRGAGKSTLLESLCASSGNMARENLLDSEVWPDSSMLSYKDGAGRTQLLRREKLGEVANMTNPEDGDLCIPIESYGQGETAETIQHSDRDPKILMDFLDGFIDFDELKEKDQELRDELLDNQSRIERLLIDVLTIPDVRKAKSVAEAQLKTLKEQKAADVVQVEERLAKESEFKKALTSKLNSLLKGLQDCFDGLSAAEVIEGLDESCLVVGKDEFTKLKSIIEGLDDSIIKLAEESKKVVNKSIEEIKQQLAAWKIKENEALEKIDKLRKDLEEQGIKLDIAFIRKVTKDVAEYDTKLRKLLEKENQLKEVRQERNEVRKKRSELKSQIFKERYKLAEYLNRKLKESAIDFFVKIEYRSGLMSPDASRIIKEAMNWRTSQVPKADLITSNISLPDLLYDITKTNTSRLEAIKDRTGSRGFSKTDALAILNTLKEPKHIFALERADYEDYPVITVTKKVIDDAGNTRFVSRDFTKLSLGQQQAILLTIMLYSKNNYPLIIDQPEDNLDSEFIYKTFVRNLRYVKERRQVIIVTHNANIAVLGDAELIIPLKAGSDKTIIVDRGSIDNPATKKIACAILEGSEQAFKKRNQIYGSLCA